MTLAEIQVLAARVGFPDPALAAAVAWAESRGNPRALGDAGDSIGLWQIDTRYHPDVDRARLSDPWYNARTALAISRGGATWQPWSTYNAGAHRPFYKPELVPFLAHWPGRAIT